MTPKQQLQEEGEKEFRLLWGLAPATSLKGKKGLEIVAFLREKIDLAYEAGVREGLAERQIALNEDCCLACENVLEEGYDACENKNCDCHIKN